jgi:hypothetical protein
VGGAVERGVMERKASASARWRGRHGGEKTSRRHDGDGERDTRQSTVAGSRRCGEFFFRKLWWLEVIG